MVPDVVHRARDADDDRVFKALADPTRRAILDALFAADGQTLGELERRFDMSRFGVMKHLKVLEDAGLVSARRHGREKHHYLNPVPIRGLHDRWISKYAEPVVEGLAALRADLEQEQQTRWPRRSTSS
jgi:DNA-binding transcriptional ArsR family regulator